MNISTNNIDNQIVSMRKQQMTIADISKVVGKTKHQVEYVLKKNGLSHFKYTKTCTTCSTEFKTKISYAKFCGTRCRGKHNKNNNGFQLVCVNCNKSFKRYENRKFCSLSCRSEHGKERTERKSLVSRMVKAIDPSRHKHCKSCGEYFYARQRRSSYCSKDCYSKHCYKKTYQHKCRECGKHYTDNILNSAGCSVECKNKWSNRINYMRRYTLKKVNGRRDWDISVERLCKRDSNKCHLCSNKVDKLDKHTNDKGYEVYGDYYPSVDHVIPLAKGGTHTWDNVKLAHRICNSYKSDSESTNNSEQLELV